MTKDKYSIKADDHGLICRPDVGGCGRPVVIVETTTDIVAFGVLRGKKNGTRAIHADELNGRKCARATRYNAIARRKELEQSCIGKKERGEI